MHDECSIEGCGKPGVKRSWCEAHYQRWKKYRDPLGKAVRHVRLCGVAGCGSKHYVGGYCLLHHRRVEKYGDPCADRPRLGGPLRFYQDVVLAYEGDDCLRWPFLKDENGYGLLYDHGKQRVHRRLCEDVNGPPPTPDHEAAHSCGMGHEACATKAHLLWKTRAGNQQDRLLHGTHLRGDRSWSAKLTWEKADDIRHQAATGVAWPVLAERFGVSRRAIRAIVKSEAWVRVIPASTDLCHPRASLPE